MAVALRRLQFSISPFSSLYHYKLVSFSTDSELDWIEYNSSKRDRQFEVNGINDCPKSCLCSNNINIDYKNVRLLSQFVSSQTGMMYPRTYTKICMTKQRQVAKAIKRSRTMGFMPYVSKIQEYVNDPELF